MMFLSGFCFLYVSFVGVYGQFLSNNCPADGEKPWSYDGLNGPRFWGIRYPDCNGNEQSPISINSVVQDENLVMLTLNNYDLPIELSTIVNDGYSIEVIPEDGVNRTIFVNGDEYFLQQLHFHWGNVYYRGSEHALNYSKYAMEMHFVHMNANNEIAVVGLFFQEQDNDHAELARLINEFPFIKYKGDFSDFQASFNLNNFLPANPTSFYRYQGSLTTPPCTEGVTWSVVPDPILVGKAQMDIFRNELYSVKEEDASDSCKLVNNYRPLQPLNDREVYASQ